MKFKNLFKNEKFYYLTILDEEDKPIIYLSEKFRLSEIDILTLIKMCIKERRSKIIGAKIMEVYKDSFDHDETVNKKLKMIGLEIEETIKTNGKATYI